jgi:hypothetical protein
VSRLREWLLWSLATAALFHRVILEGVVIVGRDVVRLTLPLGEYWAQRVGRGELPQWFEGDAFGQSYVGMVGSGPFHPWHVLGLLLPVHWAITVMVLACYPVAAAGAAALARRLGADEAGALLAGAAFGFCGYLLSMHDGPEFLACAATAPWALAWVDAYFVEGRANAAAAACALWALCLFAGDAQGFVAVGLGVVLLEAHRRAPRRAAWVVACTALLVAPQALPAWLVRADTSRVQLTPAEIGVWSTHPLRLLELFAGPLFFAQPGTAAGVEINRQLLHSPVSTLWADSLAIAPMAVVLAAMAAWHHRRARGTWLLAGAGALALFFALGSHSGANVVLAAVPVLKSFRYPEKWMLWVSLVIALGAAQGVRQRGAAACAALAVLLGLADLFLGGLPAAVRENATLALAVSAAVLAASAAAMRFERRTALAGLAIVAALPGMRIFQLADASSLDPQRGFASKVPAGARVYRQMARLDAAYGDPQRLATAFVDVLEPVARGVEGACAYLPAMTRRVWALMDNPWYLDVRLYELGSVSYLSLSDSDVRRVPGLEQVARAEPWRSRLYLDPSAVPRAYFAQPVCVAEPTVQLLTSPTFDRRHQALLECTGASTPADGDVRWIAGTPEHRTLEVDARTEGLVVVTDAFSSGWTATVDGADAPIVPVNTAFEGVRVSAGAHRVELRYRTPGLTLGLLGFALGVLALALSRYVQKARPSAGPSASLTGQGKN